MQRVRSRQVGAGSFVGRAAAQALRALVCAMLVLAAGLAEGAGMGSVPRPGRGRRRRRQLRSAGALEHDRQRRLAHAAAGSRVELADRRGRFGVPHHGGERRRGRDAGERLVPVRRAGRPGGHAPLAGLRARSGDGGGSLAPGAAHGRAGVVAPPEEHLRLGDAGHRRGAAVRPLRQRRPLCPRFRRHAALVARAAARRDPQRLGHGVVAGAARRPALLGGRQRGTVVHRRAERRDRRRGVAHGPRRRVQLVDAVRLGERRAHRDRDHRYGPDPILRPRRPAAVGTGGHVERS